MEIPLKVVQNPRHPPQKNPTSNLASYNLRPQRELGAHIRWLCSPGALFKIVGSDFYFFDFFAENFSIFKNPTSENPEISVTIGFPIVIFGRTFWILGIPDFEKSNFFGEKIETTKIGSKNFKVSPWATQSPNMCFQLPLGPKIIAAHFWSRDFLGGAEGSGPLSMGSPLKMPRIRVQIPIFSQIFDFKSGPL